MSRATPALRDLARLLTASELKRQGSRAADAGFPVCAKLGPHLATLVGRAGYHALVSRALILASVEAPWLLEVKVAADGTLEALDELHSRVEPAEFDLGRTAMLAQLLGLLVAFIGERLTVQLVREIWPRVSLDHLDFGGGGKQ